jgi:hypothetical protein
LWKKAGPHIEQLNLLADLHSMTKILIVLLNGSGSSSRRRQIMLRNAIDSVRVTSREDRPTICFICVGNPNIPLKAQIAKYATPGSPTW